MKHRGPCCPPILPLTLLFCGWVASVSAKPGKESTTKRTVELSSIFSSADQQGLKPIKANPTDPWATALRQLFENWSDNGVSNVFLVRGKDITAALKACRVVLTTGRGADVAWGPDDRETHKDFWLFAYVGIFRTERKLHSVKQVGNNIRLTYSKPDSDAMGARRFFYWVPLGQLPTGSYTLELFDADQKVVTLMRRVKVTDD
jgi:hypothetical protein